MLFLHLTGRQVGREACDFSESMTAVTAPKAKQHGGKLLIILLNLATTKTTTKKTKLNLN